MSAGALPVVGRLDVGLHKHISVHKSGGRDRWSEPLKEVPADPVEATWAVLGEVLDLLACRPDLRRAIGQAAQAYVVERHAVSRVIEIYRQALG